MKKMLFIISQPPYANSHNAELLEAAMVGAVFDGEVSILFRDDGVWGLLPNQRGELIGQKTFSKMLSALPTYEVDQLFACASSVADRDLSIATGPAMELITLEQQAILIAAQDVVIGAQR
jgi:tRNA 2-thiouridine synthesizing protein C